jgi:acyl-CoA thioester hydrolase
LLAGFPITVERALEWGEMDAMNHLNNAVYFRLFESARIAYFNKVGIFDEMERSGVGPILKSTSCKFRLPLVFPDTVTIGAKVNNIEADRYLMFYAIFSHKHQKLAAEGEGLVVSFNYRTNEKAPLTKDIIEAIKRVEKIL